LGHALRDLVFDLDLSLEPDAMGRLFLLLGTLSPLTVPFVDEGDPGLRSETAPVVLTGRVLGPDGLPRQGVRVATSAGGETLTDLDGNYCLELSVPLAAQSVQVTAEDRAGSALLSASAEVGLATSGATDSGTLLLGLGANCAPGWVQTFHGHAGVQLGFVKDLESFDDGTGPALYACGMFETVNGVVTHGVARWDGGSWSALGSGVAASSSIRTLVVFDDGGGPALYAGGDFRTIDGVSALGVAKWNGAGWSPLGSGIGTLASLGEVRALAVFDDGSGPTLYAGGQFTSAGGTIASNIAKWDGAAWSSVGEPGEFATGTFGPVNALVAFDDGTGPKLYAGGDFLNAGGVVATRIASWDGASWSGLQSPVNDAVLTLEVLDLGSGPALYAAGFFTLARGVPVNRIARWDGANWSALGGGIGGPGSPYVSALTVFDGGSGPVLLAGGSFAEAGGAAARSLAKWDGTSWSEFEGGVSGSAGTVLSLRVLDDGRGPTLFAGGDFTEAGNVEVRGIAARRVERWAALGRRGLNDNVYALRTFDDGTGSALYAGGDFGRAGGEPLSFVGRWDGAGWSALGSGTNNSVRALAVHDDGTGPALYAGGAFTAAGDAPASYIAKWDGTSWSALGAGMDGPNFPFVYALASFDDGNGAQLYAAGRFTSAGGAPANYIARWDGASWSTLGSGVNGFVRALAVFDDGTGPALYAGGEFTTAGGAPANRVARWNGTSWSALSSSTFLQVNALTVYDFGAGPRLFAGGQSNGGGIVMRWNGTLWGQTGGMSGPVWALGTFDDGSGLALYAGGSFDVVGSQARNFIARWSGGSWGAVGSGMNQSVRALATLDDGSGPALFAGGSFSAALDSHDSFLAKWGCPGQHAPPSSRASAPTRYGGEREALTHSRGGRTAPR
jgi:hypothetical protein